jgi:pimeloyl-ACP methyl ester carboxylesterase
MNSDATTPYEEIVLTCQDGIKLAGQHYRSTLTNDEVEHRILCWHGWLDNCRSFHRIGADLTSKLKNVDLVALDFPGHGASSHKSLDGASTIMMDLVYYLYDAIHQLQWQNEKITLLGHSMGAGICLMYAAAFDVDKLIMLDCLGPMTKKAEDVVIGLRRHIEQKLKGKPPNSIYPNIDTAVQVRCASAMAMPGNQYISTESAKALVTRASDTLEGGKIQFVYDQRLKWPSMMYLSQEQLNQLYSDVANSSAKVCLLLARDGLPYHQSAVISAQGLLKPYVCKTLPGSHHFHMDEDSSQTVVNEIIGFL